MAQNTKFREADFGFLKYIVELANQEYGGDIAAALAACDVKPTKRGYIEYGGKI